MFDRLRHRIADWLIYRDTVQQLDWLDDHILKDAGIGRHQIPQRARRAVEGSHGR